MRAYKSCRTRPAQVERDQFRPNASSASRTIRLRPTSSSSGRVRAVQAWFVQFRPIARSSSRARPIQFGCVQLEPIETSSSGSCPLWPSASRSGRMRPVHADEVLFKLGMPTSSRLHSIQTRKVQFQPSACGSGRQRIVQVRPNRCVHFSNPCDG